MTQIRMAILGIAFLCAAVSQASEVQGRIDADAALGRPIVVHVVVALCDNVHQGIVRVPEALGKGDDPASNLYWGAMYGVKTYFAGRGGWATLATGPASDPRILDRRVFSSVIRRNDADLPVYVVADAWKGASIKEALGVFLEMCAGRGVVAVDVEKDGEHVKVQAGGASHLVAFVGHNGLMDFALPVPAPAKADCAARGAIVLACASASYFKEHLRHATAEPVLLTTGLMAPEAYVLDAALRAWAPDGDPEKVRDAAATAYDRYQHCGMKGAKRLFWVGGGD